MKSRGISATLCNTACELVADAHEDCVDGSLLPSVLLQAGVTAVETLHVYTVLVKV